MAEWGSTRSNPVRPFTVTGLYFCGPFQVRPGQRGERIMKQYIAIFVFFFAGFFIVTELSTDASLVGEESHQKYTLTTQRYTFCRSSQSIKGATHEIHQRKTYHGSLQQLSKNPSIGWPDHPSPFTTIRCSHNCGKLLLRSLNTSSEFLQALFLLMKNSWLWCAKSFNLTPIM